MAFPYINQLYAGLNAPDAVANYFTPRAPVAPAPVPQWQQGLAVAPAAPTVNPFIASALGPTPPPSPVQAPSMRPAPPPVAQPQAQMVASGPPAPQGPVTQTQDATVGLSVAPLQYGVVNTPGRAAGELNTMGPNQERLLTKAAGTEGNAQVNAAERVATAMVAQQAPLDERAQYMAALAEREARDQTGRNEQNRQRLEDYEREAKELREMKVDPDQAVSGTQQAVHGVGAFMGTLFDALAASKGGRGNASAIVGDSYKNRQAMGMQAQQQNITNRRGYLEAMRNVMQAQRETQGDQVASNQRQAALMREATGAHLDQAGVGVAMQEALARGDVAQAQAFAKLYERQAAAQRYVPASGGGQKYVVKDPATGATMVMDAKEFNAHVKDVSKDVRGAGLGIARDTAKVDAEGKGKREEDMAKRLVPRADGGSYYAATAEEAKAHREADLAAAQLKGAVQEMKALRNKLGAADVSGYNTEDARRIKSLQAQAAVSFGKMKGLGTYDSGMEKLAEQIFGDPTGLRSPVANYDALLGRIDADAAARARSPEGAMRPNMPSSFKPVGK